MVEESRRVAITGAASGLGAALVRRLRDDGQTPIGVDLSGTDIDANLAIETGRKEAIAAILERTGGRLDGLVVAAGVGPYAAPKDIAAVNYFGSMRLIDGLRVALGEGRAPAALAVSSIGAFFDPSIVPGLMKACLADDEKAALAASLECDGTQTYSSVKRALIVAVRQRAAEWGGLGIRLNVLVPGNMSTPMLDGVYASPIIGEQTRSMPVPLARDGEAVEVAAVAAFALSEGASYMHGAILPVDGGVLAGLQPDPFGDGDGDLGSADGNRES